MNTLNQLIPLNHPNRPGTKLEALKAIIFHYTANENPGATDTMNAKYFGRAYTFHPVTKATLEADGKTPFRFGSTQVIADMDSITLAIPTDEAAWSVGDKNTQPITDANKGQQPIAKNIFGFRQNYQTISIEMCNNDAIKNSDEDWNRTVENAKQWTVDFLREKELKIDLEGSLNPQGIKTIKEGCILILRHYDISGKICPKKFVDNSASWVNLVKELADRVNMPKVSTPPATNLEQKKSLNSGIESSVEM